MKTRVAIAAFVITFAMSLGNAEEVQKSGILYGANWACMVTAPADWIMDQDSWAKNNIYGLFYEQGKKLSAAIPIIYINTQKLNDATDEEMRKFVDWDIGNAKTDPSNKVTERQLTLGIDQTALCYDFNQGNKQFETIVYLRFKDCCFLVVLATHDQKKTEENITRLIEVVQNMKFIDKK